MAAALAESPPAAVRKRQQHGDRIHNRCCGRPDCRQKRSLPARPSHEHRGTRCKRSGYIKCNIGRTVSGAASTTGARSRPPARKRPRRRSAVSPLTAEGRLAQLRARVLTLGDLKQRSATPFYAASSLFRAIIRSATPALQPCVPNGLARARPSRPTRVRLRRRDRQSRRAPGRATGAAKPYARMRAQARRFAPRKARDHARPPSVAHPAVIP